MTVLDAAPGDYAVKVSNVYVTDDKLSEHRCDDFEVTTTVEAPAPAFVPGDANDDGSVNITDVVYIVNAILGQPSKGYNPLAADLNGDGSVNITDVVLIVNLILAKK